DRVAVTPAADRRAAGRRGQPPLPPLAAKVSGPPIAALQLVRDQVSEGLEPSKSWRVGRHVVSGVPSQGTPRSRCTPLRFQLGRCMTRNTGGAMSVAMVTIDD